MVPVRLTTLGFGILAMCAVFAFSFLGYLTPTINTIGFFLLCVLTLLLTLRSLSFGLLIIFAELSIGGKGLLFFFPVGQFIIPLRLALFLIVVGIWLVQSIRTRRITLTDTPLFPVAVLWAIIVGIAFVRGLMAHTPSVAFFDANGYFFVALLPVVFAALRDEGFLTTTLTVLLAGALTLSLATIGIVGAFGTRYYSPALVSATRVADEQLRQLEELATIPENARLAQTTLIAREKLELSAEERSEDRPILYRYVQDRGIAEIAYLGGRFFRTFMASHLYVVLALFLVASKLLLRPVRGREGIPLFGSALLFLLTMIFSFSRSLWLGLLVGTAVLWFLASWRKKALFLLISAVLLISGVLFLRFGQPTMWELVRDRVTSVTQPSEELAATNRLSLLGPLSKNIAASPWIGHGFGALTVYPTLIPGTDTVEYVSVYLAEWGYHDLLIKIGFLGALVLALFIGVIVWTGIVAYRHAPRETRPVTGALLAALFALLAAHVTTPYLNHPLGIGILILSAAAFASARNTPHRYA